MLTNIRSFVVDSIKYFLLLMGEDNRTGTKNWRLCRAGTPNKRTLHVIERLHELGCDPIEGMAKIALDPQNPVEVRARMFTDLAQYVAPKRRAVDQRRQTGPAISQFLGCLCKQQRRESPWQSGITALNGSHLRSSAEIHYSLR